MPRPRWPLALLAALLSCSPPSSLGPVPHDGDVARFLGAGPPPAPGPAPDGRVSSGPATAGPATGDQAAGDRAAGDQATGPAPARPDFPYSPSSPGAPAAAAAAAAAPAPVDGELRRTARRLAGLGAAAPRGQQARQASHDRAVSESFARFEERSGQAMLRWSSEQLVPADGATVFYPFAGPDLVTARRFYPAASRYVLLALQDGGPPPALDPLSGDDLDATLDLYERVFDAFARRGFFITAQMGAGYRTPRAARGVTGVLLAFAEREGLAVEAIEPVRIGPRGVEPIEAGRQRPEAWGSVRLRLRRGDGGAVLVDYLKVDLSDAGLGADPDALGLVSALSRGPTVLKAASHLLQQRGFARLRDLVLAGAPQIVQDETGVAFARLDAFDVRLFGDFRSVNGLFDGRPQRELAAAYARGPARPLPFSVGYRKSAGAALMVATRR